MAKEIRMINGLIVATITPCHYGASYLGYALRSVEDIADESLIMYSPHPSHGTRHTDIPCPDSREDLLASVFDSGLLADPDKVRWYDHEGWNNEGDQFNAGWAYTDADIIVKLDADELYPPGLLQKAIEHGLRANCYETRLPLVHLWRSFYKGFTKDPAAPGRIYIRSLPKQETTYWPPNDLDRIWHGGYAQSLDVVQYKISIHGHRSEFRDPNWFENVYAVNRQFDCHPIGSDEWMSVESITPPDFMLDHPYAQLELIE